MGKTGADLDQTAYPCSSEGPLVNASHSVRAMPIRENILFVDFMEKWFYETITGMEIPSHDMPKEELLQVQVPASTKRDIAVKAAKAGEPLRMFVLRALAAYGVKVPATAIIDRRKSKP